MEYGSTSLFGTLVVAGVFITLAALQLWHPLRTVVAPPFRHLFVNLAIAAAAAVPVRLLVIPAGLMATTWARQHRFGI